MSASGVDQDYTDALLVGCQLGVCVKQPGEPCVNAVNGEPRDEPHLDRVLRGRQANRGDS